MVKFQVSNKGPRSMDQLDDDDLQVLKDVGPILERAL